MCSCIYLAESAIIHSVPMACAQMVLEQSTATTGLVSAVFQAPEECDHLFLVFYCFAVHFDFCLHFRANWLLEDVSYSTNFQPSSYTGRYSAGFLEQVCISIFHTD